MAIPCSCHFIDTAYVQAYLRQNGPVLTAKLAKAARARLHAQRREDRREDGLADKTLCGICADNLLNTILSESRKMYPRQHAEHLEAEKVPEAA
ncbi:MAG: hypothetical protein EON60_13190 [Alphaproteobacteria bacterium]|nr:MAG: hypothetical protein EON60_13190 [Alphaproteobacteria bacterium]